MFASADPPTVRCKNFSDTFGYEGAVFPCFYSKKNKTVVMTSYNRDTQVNTIIHFFVVPFIITVISSVGICVIHCNCSCKKERPKYRRPRIENIRQAFELFYLSLFDIAHYDSKYFSWRGMEFFRGLNKLTFFQLAFFYEIDDLREGFLIHSVLFLK